ncbi:MAG: hypothetical protein KatS3mg131_2478 [Candidatus Tectimicrobiota bacterium]|nr:MAG: hypothetical protein KatS3mg131_2478 [Candidatus Tectomicrobia bacterium]
MPFQRILVPVDFSEPSEHALQYAIDLAKQLQARLTLLHVVSAHVMPELPLTVAETTQTVPEGYLQELEKQARQGLEHYLQRGARRRPSTATWWWCTGCPSRTSSMWPRRARATLSSWARTGAPGSSTCCWAAWPKKWCALRLARCW